MDWHIRRKNRAPVVLQAKRKKNTKRVNLDLLEVQEVEKRNRILHEFLKEV